MLFLLLLSIFSFGQQFAVKPVSGCAVEFVSREQWGARMTKWLQPMQIPVSRIFIHHSAGPECYDFASCAKVVRGIQDFHMDDRGWDDIGYSFLIGGDCRVYEGRGWDRVGAHTYGFNTISVAFSLLGNYMTKLPTEIMLNTTQNLIQYAKEMGYVTEGYRLSGHRDAGCTDCPGNKLYELIQTWPRFEKGPLPGFKCYRPSNTTY